MLRNLKRYKKVTAGNPFHTPPPNTYKNVVLLVLQEGWVINPVPKCVAWAALYRAQILATLLASREQSARNYCPHFLRQEEREVEREREE
jgi:hypothetical protein